MKTSYSYAIIKENYPELERESTLLENKYKASKRYALITKLVHKDGSENIPTIVYCNDIVSLQNIAKGFVSWYNYPLGVSKDIQGFLREI
jgi:hypothetical protein